MPAFYAQARQLTAGTVVEQSYLIQLEQDNGQIFSADKNIKNVESIFSGSNNALLKNTFRLQSIYSLADIQSRYGKLAKYIEPEHRVQAAEVATNDPGYSQSPNDTDHQWAVHKAGFSNAWQITQGNKNIVIAEVDTGIDGTHEDLSAGQVGPGFNFLNKTFIPLSSNSDDNGHGTLVAGVIAATPNNFKGITGAVWNVTLMPLKALDATGSGNSADVAAAIVWAADHSANIINLSLGGIGFANDTTLSNAITYAFNKNVVIIAAGGNDVAVDGGNLDLNPVFPICDDNGENMVIGVAATDVNDQKASFSNYGKNCIDVSAPGKRILSTINFDPTTKLPSPNSYAYASGTSLAAPFVSAEAALIKANFPALSNRQIRDRIIKSAEPIDVLNNSQCLGAACTGLIGSGRINALKSLDPSLISSPISEGDLVQTSNSAQLYYITGGERQPVSQFVYNQRFSGRTPEIIQPSDLGDFPIGPYALPLNETIIKSQDNNTVYEILDGFKRPINYQVYLQRKINTNQIAVLSETEIASWLTSKFLPPTEGTLVKSAKNPTVYWVVDGLLHPINYDFWINRGLDIFPILIFPDQDLASFAQGNSFVR